MEYAFIFLFFIGLGFMIIFSFIATISLIRANRLRREAINTLQAQLEALKNELKRKVETGGEPPVKKETPARHMVQPDVQPLAQPAAQPTASPPIPSPVPPTPPSVEEPKPEPKLQPTPQPLLQPEAQPILPEKPQPQPQQPPAPTLPSREPATDRSAAFSIPASKTMMDKESPLGKTNKPAWQSKIEQQFMENWTGILGSVILVMGAAFLAVYAALQLAPVYRFFMMTGFAAALFIIFLTLRSRQKWEKLGVWMRSSACALYLFACVGAVGIPGLQWVDSRLDGFLLLFSGIAVNILAGAFSGSQFFSSFHSLLSLTALAIAPAEPITLITGAVVALASVIQTYRSRWEYHLLISISAFLSYHVYWYYFASEQFQESLPPPLRFLGIGVTLIIGMAAAFVHYRKIYAMTEKRQLPFFVHLMNWFYMAFGFYLYSTGSKWNTLAMFAASLAAFALSRKAKLLGVRWLFVMDSLIAEAIAVIAVITIYRWDLSTLPLTVILTLQIIVFMIVHLHEQEPILRRTGVTLFNLATLGVLVITFFRAFLDSGLTDLERRNDALTLGLAMLLLLGVHYYLTRKFGEELDSFTTFYSMGTTWEKHSVTGFLIGLSPLMFTGMFEGADWAITMSMGLLAVLLILGRKIELNGLSAGATTSTVAMFPLIWLLLLNTWRHPAFYYAGLGGLLFLLGFIALACSLRKKREPYRGGFWIYLTGIHFLIYTFSITRRVSPLLPGLIWLLAAPLSLALGRLEKLQARETPLGKSDLPRYIWRWSYYFLFVFIIRHSVAHLQAFDYLGPLTYRFWLEILAAAIILWWALLDKPKNSENYPFWRKGQPLMWELTLAAVTATIYIEAPEFRLPFIWVIAAFATILLSLTSFAPLRRFRLYSVFYYWLGLYYAVVISSTEHSPSPEMISQPWFVGAASLALLCGFALLFRLKDDPTGVEFPESLPIMTRMYKGISARRNRWIFYPCFAAAALFLYWTFSSALLTLLWVSETFIIFTLSLILRESQFRYLAMTGLAACLGRLLFFDMARSGTLARALVFLGVGALMIGMNALYNRYKERFTNGKE